MLGYGTEQLVGMPLRHLLPRRSGAAAARCSAARAHPTPAPRRSSAACATATGAGFQFEILHTNLLDDEHVRGIVLNSRDVSERKAFEEQLAHQAFHDSLTSWPTARCSPTGSSTRWPAPAARGARSAVVFLDLDDFKTINDSLGHGAGDEC